MCFCTDESRGGTRDLSGGCEFNFERIGLKLGNRERGVAGKSRVFLAYSEQVGAWHAG